MKTFILIGIAVLSLLLISAGIVMAIAEDPSEELDDEPEITGCSGCRGSCSLKNNCGRKTCGAVSGGKCGCRRQFLQSKII